MLSNLFIRIQVEGKIFKRIWDSKIEKIQKLIEQVEDSNHNGKAMAVIFPEFFGQIST